MGWAILSPISNNNGWAPGPVTDMTSGARGWILWVALAIMVADSLVSLLPVVFEFTHKYAFRKGIEEEDDEEVESEDRLVPLRWIIWGISGSVLIGTGLVWIVFGGDGIKPWATLIGFILGGLLSVLGYELYYSVLINNFTHTLGFEHWAKPI